MRMKNNPTNITSEGASKKLVPELRFPEFVNEGEWEEHKISEIAPLQRGFDLPIHSLQKGSFPVVYSNGIMNYHNEYKCKAPGLITGRSGTIGKFTFISSGYYWPHNTSLWVTNFNGYNPLYIYYLYQSINIEQFASGSGVPTLNRNHVHEHTCIVPLLQAEQQKIAQCLSSLDELIAATKEKVELLKEHKRGLMQKLFPVKGKTLPELRFPEFKNEGEWEEVYLGDVFTERNESNCTSLPLLSIGQDGVYPQSESNKRDISNKDKSKYKRICPNDIGYNTMRMWQGRSALSQIEGIVSPAYTIITPKKGLDPLFLSILLKLPYMVRDFHSHSQGLVNDTLNCKFNDFAKVKAKIPTLMEQQKIATILSSLDDEIEQYSEKVKALELHKKGLMQKLFPKKL